MDKKEIEKEIEALKGERGKYKDRELGIDAWKEFIFRLLEEKDDN